MNIEKKTLEKVDVLYDDKKWGKRIDPDEWNANFKALENAHNQLVDSLTEQVNIVDEAFSNATTEGGNNIHVDYSGGDFTLQQALDHVVNDINNRYTKLQSDTLLAENTNVLIRDISYNSQTGTFTITKKDGSVITIDTVIEKVPASMVLKEETDGSVWLVITNQDGSQTKTNVTSLIEDTVINSSDTINVSSSTDSVNKVTTYILSIKPNSIGLAHVDSELTTKFEETQNAKTLAVQAKDLAIQAKNNAETYASNANTYSVNSNKSATESANSALEAKRYAEQASSYKNSAESAKVAAEKARDEAQAIVGGTVQSDWNINDESSSEYIKNRPFYTVDIVETVLLEETTAEFRQSSGTTYGSGISISPGLSFVVGTTYNVSWDGTLYTCISYELDGSAVIGSQYIVTGAGDDTGEPFLMAVDVDTLLIFTRDTSASHTISITGFISEVVKIDKKYIPELDNYLSKDNPIGTGFFSLNRKADTTVGLQSFAEGNITTASGSYSHAEGDNTTASGYASHAEGDSTTASDSYSHAEGYDTTASCSNSHAECYRTTASGFSSHAEGDSTTASGGRSHSEGYDTTASGSNSHAEGYNTTASGNSSHAEGFNTTASSDYQHTQGKYNIEDSSNIYADIIGNGTSDTKKSNASTVDWSGNAWYAGNVYVGSTSGTNKDEGSKKLATEDYVSSLKPAITATTLLASSWDSTAKTYSFESTYPNASYDIEVALDSTATTAQVEAFNGAQIVGSATSNVIKAYGTIPTVNIPIIVKVVTK